MSKTTLYLLHGIIVWTGTTREIVLIFSNQSARDVALFWIVCLLVANIISLPLAVSSKYFVWKLCHIVSTCLVVLLLTGVILFR